MKAPTRILVPIDMSVFSVTALQYAEEMATHFGAEIIVLHIAEEDDLAARIPKKEREQMTKAEIDQRLKSAVAHMLLDHNVVTQSMRIEIRHGEAANEIVNAVPEVHADLIVMCTHGRSGLSHMIMGSVAEKVVRTAACPVLTLKPDELREVVNLTQDDVAEGLHLT